MKSFKALIVLTLALVMCLALFAGCGTTKTDDATGTDGDTASSDLEYVLANGKLVVGITDFAPMDYKDENGEWIGFDADMAKAFAEYLGVEVEFVEIDWDNKVLELDGKSIACVIDLLMAGAMIGEGASYENLAYTVELNSEEYGVGFRKDSDIAAKCNEFLAAAYADGSMLETAKLYGVQESIIAQ